jgi:hypothetical protein
VASGSKAIASSEAAAMRGVSTVGQFIFGQFIFGQSIREIAGGLRFPSYLQEPLILIVRADPEPNEGVLVPDGESTISPGNTRRPEFAHWLQLNGSMGGVVNQQFILLVGAAPNLLRQFVI